jgi:hypothetical protein
MSGTIHSKYAFYQRRAPRAATLHVVMLRDTPRS